MNRAERATWLRLLLFLGGGLGLSFLSSPRLLLLALAALALPAAWRGRPRASLSLLAWSSLVPLPGLAVLFLLAGREQTGSWASGAAWGLARLAPYAARLAALMLLNLLFIQATPLPDLLAALRRLPLPRGASLLLATFLRFLPTALEEARRVVEAQRARGLDRRRLLTPSGLLSLAVPLFLAQLQRARDLALSLEIRGCAAPADLGEAP